MTASNFRDAAAYPSGILAFESALTWIHQVGVQEGGWRKVLGGQVAARKALPAAFDTVPVADADAAAVGHHVPFFQDWIVHETRVMSGGIRLISGGGSIPYRRQAWWGAGTTSSCPVRSTTTTP